MEKKTFEETAEQLEEKKMAQLKDRYVKSCVNQIMYISRHGCSGIKCKWCAINKSCDHYPSHSKDVALSLIAYANSL